MADNWASRMVGLKDSKLAASMVALGAESWVALLVGAMDVYLVVSLAAWTVEVLVGNWDDW